jgi:16S rRNA (guanine(966)-N(2))-methyltransferase RsmD
LRIISGKYKGRQLHPHKTFNARPTTDFAKESLFNILNNHFYFDRVKVLDLFAGTGGIGLEFFSRGCDQVEMIEIDSKNHRFIADAIKQLGINQVKLIRGDALKYLQSCKPGYDIIFADPPFDLKSISNIPDIVFKRNLLNDEGWLILEHSKSNNFKSHPRFKDERVYGSVHFSIFVTSENENIETKFC